MGKAQKFKEQRKQERNQKQEKKKRRKNLILKGISLMAGLVILASLGFIGFTVAKNRWFDNKKITQKEELKVDKVKGSEKKVLQAPEMKIDPNKKYIAKVETNKGNFEITLDAKAAPKTVNNFVSLAKDKFYDDLVFHRIVKGFMIQGGDPEGTGTGGPGYTIPAEIKLKHTTGAIATARQGDEANPNKDSSGSQFFIDLADQPSLDQAGYTVFGQVTSGMDNIQKIGATPTSDNEQGEKSKPNEVVKIKKITIEEK